MLLWRRNVKISHYSIGSGPVETGLLHVIISGLVCIVCPILLTLYGGELYGNSEQRILELDGTYAKESVLVVNDNDGNMRIFSTTGSFGEDVDLDCSMSSSENMDSSFQQVTQSFKCSISDVIAFELFTYFNLKMNGFTSPFTDDKYLSQLVLSSSSSFRSSSRADIISRVEFVQSNMALLPVESTSTSATPALLPSMGDVWSPEDAIKNHTNRELRFDQTNIVERWSSGSADNFELNVIYEFPSVLVSRNEKLWNKIKSYFIQFLAFFIVFLFVIGKLNNYLFESNTFTTFTRMDNITQVQKRG